MNANPINLVPPVFDVVIVGAGPSGATAAYYLSKSGVKVLLLDRQTFPRDKVCGDFVSPVSIKELQNMGITELEEFKQSNRVNKAAVFLNGEELIVAEMPGFEGLAKEGRVIPRKQLDNWILVAAKREGAKVIEGALVTGFKVKPECVEVTARIGEENRLFRAQLLIGADGTNSVIASILHGHPPLKANRTIGVRAYFENVTGSTDRADMHFSNMSFPGYFWLFPVGNGQANVGVGILLETTPKSSQPKDLFYQLINSDPAIKNRLKDAKITGKLETWPINSYDPTQPLTADRVLLTGEAAGLVNAINGEGIQYALLSGKWAAQTASECIKVDDCSQNALSSYVSKVQTELAAGFETSAFIVQFIRNRNLNPLWLKTFETMVAKAKSDPQYASIAGGILSGMISPTEGLTPQFMISTLEEATVANTIRIVSEAITNPSSLPKNVIKITEYGFEAAVNSAQNPFELLQWSMETVAKMAEFAFTVPSQIGRDNAKASKDASC